MIVGHDHEDITKVVIGCKACITAVRAQEAAARWSEAPLRTVTWTCSYFVRYVTHEPDVQELSFSCDVRVPSDATAWEVDEEYADITGEAFVMALPDSVPMEFTTYACETMEVEKVTIGPLVAVPAPVEPEPPALFEVLS